MIISFIAAVSENNVIGNKGKLPWDLPDDLKHFRTLTDGHAVIMGRKTFESIGRALPGRLNVVISRQASRRTPLRLRAPQPDKFTIVESLQEGIAAALMNGEEEAFVIGGGEIYAQAMDMADRLYLTRVHAEVEGDVFFPEVDLKKWKELSRERHEKDSKHAYAFTFITLEHIRP